LARLAPPRELPAHAPLSTDASPRPESVLIFLGLDTDPWYSLAGGEPAASRSRMDFKEIRKIVIQAVFSDEELTDKLVLKGGNALEIALGIISRGSIDLDFSMQGDFEDSKDVESRLFRALEDRFDAHGLVVFDQEFEAIPPDLTHDATPWWGGYRAKFKLLPRKRYEELSERLAKAQIEALPIAPNQERTFSIDISKHEFCSEKEARELDGFTIWLYTPAMLAIEKIRAVCQQMPEYQVLQNKRARGRDFYDIHAIVSKLSVDLSSPENLSLTRAIFEAKRVPLSLLSRIGDSSVREFHRMDWERVRAAVVGEVPAPFDSYFDFVAREAAKLKALWDE
jgi:hypothetical protein